MPPPFPFVPQNAAAVRLNALAICVQPQASRQKIVRFGGQTRIKLRAFANAFKSRVRPVRVIVGHAIARAVHLEFEPTDIAHVHIHRDSGVAPVHHLALPPSFAIANHQKTRAAIAARVVVHAHHRAKTPRRFI